MNNGSGTVTLGADPTVNGTLTIAAGGTCADGGFTLTAKSTVSNSGTHSSSGSGKLLFAGAAAQTVTGVFGNVELNNASGTSIGGTTTINGNLTVTAGTLSVAGVNLTVNGATTVTSTLSLVTSTTGTKTFDDVTVNGTWSNPIAEGVTITGNLVNNGTFTAGAGVHSLTGSSKTISGTISIPTLTVTGTYANSGTLTVATLLTVTSPGVLTNNGTITATTALSGTGNLTQGANAILNITGTSGITGLTATANPNTVNYNLAGIQTVKPTAYHHLTLSGSGAKTMTSVVTIGGDLTVSGSATITGNAAFALTGALNYGSSGSSTLTAATPISIGTFNQTAGIFVDNGNTITVTGTRCERLGEIGRHFHRHRHRALQRHGA